jgi:hypothetical protein
MVRIMSGLHGVAPVTPDRPLTTTIREEARVRLFKSAQRRDLAGVVGEIVDQRRGRAFVDAPLIVTPSAAASCVDAADVARAGRGFVLLSVGTSAATSSGGPPPADWLDVRVWADDLGSGFDTRKVGGTPTK